ncbi:MAG: hypothetical protein R2707_09370 [Acidimicrobiales bacterium]
MSFPEMAWAILRKWWVFVPVMAIGLFATSQLRTTGAEYIAEARVTVTLPRTDNTLLDSARGQYRGPAIIAAVEMLDDEYRSTVSALGLPDTFSFDWQSEFPIIVITLRGPTRAGVSAAADVVSQAYVERLDLVQSDRDIIGAARFRGVVTAITDPPNRPPGSNRALLGLVAASTMLAGGAAYAVDQFVLPAARPRPRPRRDLGALKP